MVALGVLATEFLVWWGRQATYFHWRSRRATWVDLVSEEDSWAQLPPEVDTTLARQQVAALLRSQLDGLDQWLADSPAVTADKWATHHNQLTAKIQALAQSSADYLKTPWAVAPLEALAVRLAGDTLAQASAALQAAQAHIKTLDTAFDGLIAETMTGSKTKYRALLDKWQASPPTDADLKATWELLAGLPAVIATLRQPLPASMTVATLLEVAKAAGLLQTYLSGYVDKICTPAGQHILKAAGKDSDAVAVLADFANLANPGSALRQAQAQVTQAQKPLANPTLLHALTQHVAQLRSQLMELPELSQAAGRAWLLKLPLAELHQADTLLSQPQADLAQVWATVGFSYHKSRRWVHIGRRLERLKASQDTDVQAHRAQAYRCLINGDAVAAEVSLERAEMAYLQARRAARQPKFPSLGPLLQPWVGLPAAPAQPSRLSRWGWLAFLLLGSLLTILIYPWLQGGSPVFGSGSTWGRWLWGIGAVLLGVGVVVGLSRALARAWRRRGLSIWLDEAVENVGPWLAHFTLEVSSQLTTILVAVVLIVVAQNLADVADTWGSPFDFFTAFGWGVLANRVAEPAQSTLKRVQQWLSDKSAAPEEKAEADTPAAATPTG